MFLYNKERYKKELLINELLKMRPKEKIPYNIYSKISWSDGDIAFHELAIYNRLYFTLSYKVEYIFEVEAPDNYRYKNGIRLDYDKYDIFIYDEEFPAVKKMMEVSKLLLEIRTN